MTEFYDALQAMRDFTDSQKTTIYNRSGTWMWVGSSGFVNGRPAPAVPGSVHVEFFKAWDPSRARDRHSQDFMATSPEQDTWLGEFARGEPIPPIGAAISLPEGKLTLTTLQTVRRSTGGTPFIAKLTR